MEMGKGWGGGGGGGGGEWMWLPWHLCKNRIKEKSQ